MKVSDNPEAAVTKEQLREAEEGLLRLLFAKRFPREWIERHVPEVMAQAQADFAARIAAGREDRVVGLLVVIAYRRALKVLRSQTSRAPSVPLEEVYHLPDTSARTPEQELIRREGRARLLKAMTHLPKREQRLLSLIYFGEMTAKEAGRRLGWSPSSAARHQRAALAKLREQLGEGPPALAGLMSPEPHRADRSRQGPADRGLPSTLSSAASSPGSPPAPGRPSGRAPRSRGVPPAPASRRAAPPGPPALRPDPAPGSPA